jgi:phosphate transport system substrate-binding protein
MRHLRAAVLAALCLFQSVLSAAAQDITLTAPDGAVEISGTLLGFDGEFYRIDTIYGVLTVDGTGVNCEGPACPNLTNYVAELVISGASSMADVLVPALVEAFALRSGYSVLRDASNDNLLLYELNNQQSGDTIARFAINATTTDEGFADLLANEADIAMALREIRNAEADRAEEAGLGDLRQDNRSRVVALSALIPVTEIGNPVKSLSALQLAQVFAGKITNWKELGGVDAPISLHLPAPGSGLWQAIQDGLMTPANLRFSSKILYYQSLSDLVRSVQFDPFALGISAFERTGGTLPMKLSGGCGHEISATRRGIKTEDYPLSTPMYFYVPAVRQPKVVRDFLRYVQSDAAQIVVRRAGYVDQASEQIPMAAQGERLVNAIGQAGAAVQLEDLQKMVTELSPLKRLTTTFRFTTGVSQLDAHSLSNVELLAQRLERGDFDGHELVFVGFSDGSGGASANLQVSLRRADKVLQAVQAAAETADLSQVTLTSTGYGEAFPVACDDTAWGRGVNRRVEVWLR